MPEIVIFLCRPVKIRPCIELVRVLLYIIDLNPRRGSVGGRVKWVWGSLKLKNELSRVKSPIILYYIMLLIYRQTEY